MSYSDSGVKPTEALTKARAAYEAANQAMLAAGQIGTAAEFEAANEALGVATEAVRAAYRAAYP